VCSFVSKDEIEHGMGYPRPYRLIVEGTQMLDSIISPPCQEPTQAPDNVRPAHDAPDERTRHLAHDIVARFVLDPSAFARSAGAEPEAFVRTYRESLDRRLAAVDPSRPAARPTLATLGVSPASVALLPNGVPLPEDGGIRMGAVVAIALAVAAVAMATAVATIVTAMTASRHMPY
jgi:hypothetical protein